MPALRGARDLEEARRFARAILEPEPVRLEAPRRPTLERFAELRTGANGGLDEDAAKEILRELKAVGGDLKSLRLALTGAAKRARAVDGDRRAAARRGAEAGRCGSLAPCERALVDAPRRGADRDVRLRPDRLSARAHRQRAAVSWSAAGSRAGCGCAAAR